jgi:hypothetical protein
LFDGEDMTGGLMNRRDFCKRLGLGGATVCAATVAGVAGAAITASAVIPQKQIKLVEREMPPYDIGKAITEAMNAPEGAQAWARVRAAEVLDHIKKIKEEEGGVLQPVPVVPAGQDLRDTDFWLETALGSEVYVRPR